MLKGVQSIQMLFVKDFEVCILALKREDSVVANYPEMYKEKRSLPGIFPSLLKELREATQL